MVLLFIAFIQPLANAADTTRCIQWHGLENQSKPCLTAVQLDTFLSNTLKKLQGNGYLSASIDSVLTTKDNFEIFVYLGTKYRFHQIIWDTLTSFPGYSELRSEWNNKLNNIKSPYDIPDQIIKYLNQNGYPNAMVKGTPVFEDEKTYSLLVQIVPGDLVTMGDIVLQGDSILSTRFLRNYLFWHSGEKYDHRLINQIEQKINNLAYVQLEKTPEIGLEYDKVNLILALGKEKANVFDFIIGVLPSGEVGDQRIIFSVYLNTVLHNLLNQGERLSVKFVNTRPETQELNMDLEYPYLGQWPLGVSAGLQLYRDENTHIDLKYHLGTVFQSRRNISFNLYWERQSSSLLNPDTLSLIRENTLPEELDFTTNRIGFSGKLQNVDDIYAPRKGFIFHVGVSGGQKRVEQNQDLLEFQEQGIEVQQLYDSLGGQQFQMELKHEIHYYRSLSKRFSLALIAQGKYLISERNLLFNELYRIGGSNLLRGFDEQFFSVNEYTMLTSELRFFLDQRSYFSTFLDLAYLKSATFNAQREGWVNGFGLGMNFQTTVGVFHLNYALGSGLGLPFNISTGKIHFGYVNLF